MAKYPTGAVAVLDFSVQRWKEVAPNSGMLALYLTPAEIQADADQSRYRPERNPGRKEAHRASKDARLLTGYGPRGEALTPDKATR